MTHSINKTLSRRDFIKRSAMAGTALMAIPGLFTACSQKPLRLGFIGLGRQGIYLVESFVKIPNVLVSAGSDVYDLKRSRFQKRMNDYYTEKGLPHRTQVYEDYRDMLKDPSVDAVVIATPDHWHALAAIDAAEAGKHVYLEKPLTFTIYEGIRLVETVRRKRIVLAVGSMQRSEPLFRHAVELVQDRQIGDIEKVAVWLGGHPHPKPYDLAGETVPEGLNWDAWCGPIRPLAFNHQLNPPISLDPEQDETLWGAWRWYKEMGGGLMTDWGAHMIDIAQWGLGMDGSAPTKIIPAGLEGRKHLSYIYESGLEMTLEPIQGDFQAVKFFGKKGWIEVGRDHFKASSADWQPDFEIGGGAGYWPDHHLNFVEAVLSGKDPLVPVESGHSSCTVCTLGNIAYELQEVLIWDPAGQSFVNNARAEKQMHYDYRSGYPKL